MNVYLSNGIINWDDLSERMTILHGQRLTEFICDNSKQSLGLYELFECIAYAKMVRRNKKKKHTHTQAFLLAHSFECCHSSVHMFAHSLVLIARFRLKNSDKNVHSRVLISMRLIFIQLHCVISFDLCVAFFSFHYLFLWAEKWMSHCAVWLFCVYVFVIFISVSLIFHNIQCARLLYRRYGGFRFLFFCCLSIWRIIYIICIWYCDDALCLHNVFILNILNRTLKNRLCFYRAVGFFFVFILVSYVVQ